MASTLQATAKGPGILIEACSVMIKNLLENGAKRRGSSGQLIIGRS